VSSLIFNNVSSSPAAVGSGKSQLYMKTDGKIYRQTESNAEEVVNAGEPSSTDSTSIKGTVLQVVYKHVTQVDVIGVGNQSDNAITALNTSITTKAANSHIFYSCCLTFETNHDSVLRLYRDSTSNRPAAASTTGYNSLCNFRSVSTATEPDYTGNDGEGTWVGHWVCPYDNDDSSTGRTHTFQFMDWPADTTSGRGWGGGEPAGVTHMYKMMIRGAPNTSSFRLNQTMSQAYQSSYERGTSLVTIMEIAT
jgi:hypothetical protein